MHLLYQAWIPGETFGIEIAHLIDQRLQFALCLRTILYCRANSVEQVQSLVNVALGVGRIGTLLRRNSAAGDVSIAGVVTAIHGGTAIGPAPRRITYWTSEPVAHGTSLLSSSGLLPGTCLPGGTAWSLLLTALLTGAARLTAEAGELIAHTGKIVHSALDPGIL